MKLAEVGALAVARDAERFFSERSDSIVDGNTGEIVTQDDAWERHRRIVALRNAAQKTFLQLGEELYWMESKEQYTDLGHETFNSYLADSEVDIGRAMAFRLKRVYKRFVLELESLPGRLLEAGVNKLALLAPHVTEDNADEWIAKAAALSRSDFRQELKDAFPKDTPPLPQGKYAIIYADPPWDYDNSGFDQSAASHYPTMSTKEIGELDIPALCSPESVLFLWATSPLLDQAFKVMKDWGFKYKASMVWDKGVAPGMGWFVSTKHEFLLIGTRESNRHPKTKVSSVVQAERSRHSKKPAEFYDIIESMYEGPYCELFARNTREGWESWGNEV